MCGKCTLYVKTYIKVHSHNKSALVQAEQCSLSSVRSDQQLWTGKRGDKMFSDGNKIHGPHHMFKTNLWPHQMH